MIFLKIKDPNIVKSRTSPVTHTLTTSYMSLHNRCYWFIVILMQPVPPAVSSLSPISVHLPAIIFQSCDLTCRLFTRTVTPLRSTPVSEITPLITARDPCFNFTLGQFIRLTGRDWWGTCSKSAPRQFPLAVLCCGCLCRGHEQILVLLQPPETCQPWIGALKTLLDTSLNRSHAGSPVHFASVLVYLVVKSQWRYRHVASFSSSLYQRRYSTVKLFWT